MSAPRLNRKLALERAAVTPDGAGGRSTVAARASAYRVRVRALPEGHSARPRAGDRFRVGGRVFDVLTVQEDGPAARYLLCTVEEEVTP